MVYTLYLVSFLAKITQIIYSQYRKCSGQRIQSGKSKEGTITLSIEETPYTLEILLSDHGVGLNIHKIYEKGLEQKQCDELVPPSIDEMVNSIFRSGFTTRDFVTNISVRGVRMDAVNQFLQEVGGEIRIETPEINTAEFFLYNTAKYALFQIRVLLPKTKLIVSR